MSNRVFAVLVISAALAGRSGAGEVGPETFVTAIAPSVVSVTGFMGGAGATPFAQASGFFIEPSGLVVTINSAFTETERRLLCERFELRLSDGRRLPAQAHAVDAVLNLLLLTPKEFGVYPALATDSNVVRAGDPVIAVAGSDVPDERSFALGRVKAREKRSVYGLGLGDLYLDLELDPPPAADGGPLLDGGGQAIGILSPNIFRSGSARETPGEAHAVPIRTLRGFLKLSAGHPLSEEIWMGLAFRPLAPDEMDVAASLLGRRAGLFVDFVWAEGPAGKADIRVGDVLVGLNGTDLADLYALDRRLSALGAGSSVELALLRGNSVVFRTVGVEKRPLSAGHVPWKVN